MKYTIKCSHCGHVSACYTHRLNGSMINSLRQLIDFYKKKNKGANLQKDLDLTKNQYNNFQKLQYFELAFRTKEGWFPSRFGMDFICGNSFAPNFVATINNEVIGRSHPAWKTHKQNQEYISVHDVNEKEWKKDDEYKEEKSSQEKLF